MAGSVGVSPAALAQDEAMDVAQSTKSDRRQQVKPIIFIRPKLLPFKIEAGGEVHIRTQETFLQRGQGGGVIVKYSRDCLNLGVKVPLTQLQSPAR